jgi:hypothetical protein
MKINQIGLVIVILLAISTRVNSSLWNQLIAFDGQLQLKDFVTLK